MVGYVYFFYIGIWAPPFFCLKFKIKLSCLLNE